MSFTDSDRRWMTEALRLAREGLYTTHPNPRVGCVLVRDSTRIGSGSHLIAGGPHAEVAALTDAGGDARGASCYVNLEPCSHQGRTPPCVDALVAAGVRRVVAAMQDPNPLVSGRGLQALQAAGIEVACGLMEADARQLNRGFIRRMQNGLPYVTVKLAMSLDGRTAMATGESQWITGAPARRDVQRLRAQSAAIMTGIGTVLADDPSLTVRAQVFGDSPRQPLRVVVDSQARLPSAARLLSMPGQTRVYTLEHSIPADRQQAALCRVVVAADENGQVSLPAVLQDLAGEGVNEVLVEAGAGLSGALLQQGLVDELIVYMAPRLLGSDGRGLLDLPGVCHLADSIDLETADIRRVGKDWRMTLYPQQRS